MAFVHGLEEKRNDLPKITPLLICGHLCFVLREKFVSPAMIQKLMLVHGQCFLFKLKYANEEDGFASVFCTDWVSQWGVTEGSKSGLCCNTQTHDCTAFEDFCLAASVN